MQRLLYFTATTTALTLARFTFTPSWEAATGFAISAGLFAFLSHMERGRMDDRALIEERLTRAESQLSNISVGLGWTQTR